MQYRSFYKRRSHALLCVGLVCTFLFISGCAPITPLTHTQGNALPTLMITIDDNGVTAPAEAPAGFVQVITKNALSAGSGEQGECGSGVDLVRLAAGASKETLIAALQNGPLDPAIGTALGGGCAKPGGETQTIYQLEAGSYVALTSSETAIYGAVIHVKDPIQQATAPQPEIKAQFVDFSFVLPDEIKAGAHLWQISNDGKQWHEMSIVRLREGVTIDDLIHSLMSNEPPAGPPPGQELVNWQFASPGATAWSTIDLPAGEYYVLCFLPDMSSNPPLPHAGKGMVRPLKVVE